MDFPQVPREEEMQYTRDVLHGKRKKDLIAIAVFAVVGFILGIAIGYAGTVGMGKPFDIGTLLLSAVFVAACLAVVAGLMIVSVRSIIAMCRAWTGARVLTALACLYILWRVFGYVQFAVLAPSLALSHGVMGAMGLVFFVLIFNPVLRLVFFVYCKVTGKDDDHLISRNIAADSHEVDRRMGKDAWPAEPSDDAASPDLDAHSEGPRPVYVPGQGDFRKR